MNEEKPVDLGDSASVKDQRKVAKQTAAARKETLISFMSSEGGRKWFYELLLKAQVYQNPFNRDALQMSFNCGEMNIGYQILLDIENANPELYLLMMKENRDAE